MVARRGELHSPSIRINLRGKGVCDTPLQLLVLGHAACVVAGGFSTLPKAQAHVVGSLEISNAPRACLRIGRRLSIRPL
jgi:hypothetical protein